MLPIEEIAELDERDADEPLQDEAETLVRDELEVPSEPIGVPYN
jgi:hypothetical protein